LSSPCTSDASSSLGGVAIGAADLEENKLPTSRADSFADFEVDSHPSSFGADLIRLNGGADFLLFNVPPALFRTTTGHRHHCNKALRAKQSRYWKIN
jgi:hypothetical protein